jgi:heme/copper-type cytochrome/quinol oxidase subunit 2
VDVFGDTEGGLNALLVTLVAVPLGVLVLAVIILAAGRGEPDTSGRRAFAVYLAAVNFVAIFTLVFASFAAVQSLADLVVDGKSEDAAVRGAVQAGLIVGAAVVALVFHARRRRELQAGDEFERGGPAWRIDRAYLYAVCFVAVLVALFALGVGAYGVFRTLAPGVTGEFTPRHLERQEGVAQLVSQAWLGLVALYVFVRAWREVAAEAV